MHMPAHTCAYTCSVVLLVGTTCTAAAACLHPQIEQVVPFSPDCTLRVMRLSDLGSDSSHLLSHYHFHAWPDHGIPDSSAGLRAVCRALSTARESGAPVVVHCSAVSGRGGGRGGRAAGSWLRALCGLCLASRVA